METYRAPKAVIDEATDDSTLAAVIRSGSPLSFADVVEMRSVWQGEAGQQWSAKLVDNQVARLAAVSQKESSMKQTRAAGSAPELGEELTELLADVVSFYFRAQGAHWNVTGTDFAEYHKLFGDIYADAYSSIDPIAENLRKIGFFAPFQLPQLVGLRSLQDTNVGSDARALAKDLLDANAFLIEEIAEAFNCASAHGEQGIANFLADRLDKHQMWRWQLSASLGEEVVAEELPTVAEYVEEPMGEEPRATDLELEARKSAMATAERLTMTAEVRAMQTSDGSLRIGGYAAQFNQEATGLNFREQIAPGAFKRSLESRQPVFLLVNHDADQLPLASTQGGTLMLTEDSVGLRMEADLDPSNPRALELLSALKRGDVDKMSFAFSVAPGGEVRDSGLRTLTDVDLFEVSVVTWPAYDSTTVGMRSAEPANLDLRKRRLALKRKLQG